MSLTEKEKSNLFTMILVGAFVGLMLFILMFNSTGNWFFLFIIPVATLLCGSQAYVMIKQKRKKDDF